MGWVGKKKVGIFQTHFFANCWLLYDDVFFEKTYFLDSKQIKTEMKQNDMRCQIVQ